jgi:hypothetical protein
MSIQGRNTTVGLGEESTWGTEVARSAWIAVASVELAGKASYLQSDSLLHGSGVSANAGHMTLEKIELGGSIEAPLFYEGGSAIGLLLKHALGTVSTTGAGPYTHTFTLAGALPTGLTLEVIRGSTALAEEIYGAKISRLELSVSAGQQMRAKVDLIAKNQQARASGGTPSIGTRYPVLHKHAGANFAFNSVNYSTVTSFKLVIDNKLTREQVLGSEYTQEPVRSQHQEVTVEIELNAVAETLYIAHLAGTEASGSYSFTDGTNTLAFTFHNLKVIEYGDPISGPGTIKQKVKFRALLGSSTNYGLSVALTNSKSSAVTD